MRIIDWSSDVCSSDIRLLALNHAPIHLPVIHSQTRLEWICGQAPTAVGGRVSAIDPTMHPASENRRWLSKRDIKRGSPYLRSEEHTSDLQSLMRTSSAVICLKQNMANIEHSE